MELYELLQLLILCVPLFLLFIEELLPWEPARPVDKAQHSIKHIGDEAHRQMEQLTTQYREYLDEQTRQYR